MSSTLIEGVTGTGAGPLDCRMTPPSVSNAPSLDTLQESVAKVLIFDTMTAFYKL